MRYIPCISCNHIRISYISRSMKPSSINMWTIIQEVYRIHTFSLYNILHFVHFIYLSQIYFQIYANYHFPSEGKTLLHRHMQEAKPCYLPLASKISMVTLVVAINFPSVAVTSRMYLLTLSRSRGFATYTSPV